MSRQHSTDIWYDYQKVNIKLCIPGFAQLKPTAPKREKILAAAAELLLTEGFHALTQHAVAARAGIRQSHLTYYFPTRNDCCVRPRNTASRHCSPRSAQSLHRALLLLAMLRATCRRPSNSGNC